MSKISVNELSGTALDYAVALAEGGTNLQFDTVATYWITINGKDLALARGWAASMSFAPSIGSAGDAIIDREGIATRRASTGVWYAMMSAHLGDGEHASWCKTSAKDGDRYGPHSYQVHKRQVRFEGATRREAALRCYVASKLPADGKDPTVEIPKELA